MTVFVDMSFPMGINLRIGKKEYTKEQLARYQPIWVRQWELQSDLDKDLIKELVYEIHTGPNQWPGNRISSGCAKGIVKNMRMVEWDWRKRSYTGSQLYREAKKRMNAEIRKIAKAYGVDDPWGAEYYLTGEERKRVRDWTVVRP